MKLCKDCKWYQSNFFAPMAPSCNSPDVAPADLVRGGVKYLACSYARENESGLCGVDARFWGKK